MKHRKRGEDVTDGKLVFKCWAITYKDRPAMKWDRKLRRNVPEKVNPETFFKEPDRAPRLFVIRQNAVAERDKLAQEFSTGIWRVVEVELTELAIAALEAVA